MGDLVNRLRRYEGARVLITGDTGFKGSWLALWLAELGAEVRGFALPPERAEDHFLSAGVGRRIRHTDGDIRNLESFETTFRDFRPEFLFHLAAQPLVRRSYRDPKETFDTNVGGSVNILETARRNPGLKALVFVTSDKCYRNKEWIWGYRENDELGGRDPYSASKAAAEIVFSSYWDSFLSNSLGAASVRAGNVIGGGDWAEDRIVPDCVRALSAGKPIVLRNPRATRPWQHVLEPLSGYLSLGLGLAEDPAKHSGSWNFGPENSAFKTVQDLARGILEAWGSGEIVIRSDPGAPHEAGLLHLNCDKARHGLDWSPRWNFRETVDRTISWYRASDKAAESVSQIREYMEASND